MARFEEVNRVTENPRALRPKSFDYRILRRKYLRSWNAAVHAVPEGDAPPVHLDPEDEGVSI